MAQQWVYGFHQLDEASAASGDDWDEVRGLLGGKGANLGDMTRLGIAVPPGFTITSQACNAYLDNDFTFPAELSGQIRTHLSAIEDMTGKTFGDPTNPLLLSCRSGAKFSMPGMMDTVLNIGMNDEVVKGMVEMFDDRHFVLDSYRRLIQMFATVVMGVR
ncbi:MAG: PEP/pyruvate-binding domain-containing protein, partial [Acidimicrobiia bacterium]